MKKFLVISVVLLSSLAVAQNWEYGLLVSGISEIGKSSYQWIAQGETTGQRIDLERVFEDLAGRPVDSTLGAQVSLFNFLGAEGWELVAVESSGQTVVYIFKRPK